MNAVDIIARAESFGVRMKAEAGLLALEAEHAPPPALVNEIRQHKRAILRRLLRRGASRHDDDWSARFRERSNWFEGEDGLDRGAAEARAFDWCVAEWLARRPTAGPRDRCAWCGKPAGGAPAVTCMPVRGSAPARLHAHCALAWRERRRREAEAALARCGITKPPAPENAKTQVPQLISRKPKRASPIRRPTSRPCKGARAAETAAPPNPA